MNFNGNWVDLIIIVVLLYFAFSSWRDGFLFIFADFISFLLSLLVSLRIYKYLAIYLKTNFAINSSAANALSFIATTVFIEILVGFMLRELIIKLPPKILKSKINKILGIVPAIGQGLILVAFLLTAVVVLPVRPDIKKAVSQSQFGGVILQKTAVIESSINQVFGGAINDALTYLTIEPKSNETIKLDAEVGELTVDEKSEEKMLTDLNKERVSRGFKALTHEASFSEIARDYARDMWIRGYFSHYSPEGKNVADRFSEAGIKYKVVGENLAYAPTEETAHTGLMNSEGHKANILSSDYSKVGVGVIDNGIYGKIFVQVFRD